MKKVALVACSNGQTQNEKETIEKLKVILQSMEIETIESPFLYARNGYVSGNGRERAEVLNQFYKDDTIDAIFDLSGGDMANEVLSYINYQAIQESNKPFYGYSDLTTILNGIYSQTGKQSILFQMKNLVWEESGIQIKRFQKHLQGASDLLKVEWSVLQGNGNIETILKENIVVGGNIRCFLKLAGTKYFPCLEDKILFLESMSGGVPRISTYMAQLNQIGAFQKVKAVLLGTFTELERGEETISAYQIMKEYLSKDMLVAQTKEIGHAYNAKAIKIG